MAVCYDKLKLVGRNRGNNDMMTSFTFTIDG